VQASRLKFIPCLERDLIQRLALFLALDMD